MHILILDPERTFAPAFRKILLAEGYRVTECRSLDAFVDTAKRDTPNLVIKASMASPNSGPMQLLRKISPDTQILIAGGKSGKPNRPGVFERLPLPCPPATLLDAVRRALENQRIVAKDPTLIARLQPRHSPNILAGESPAMRSVRQIVERVADTDATILIQGESGTGKELVARLLHERSHRSLGPFVAVNCAALTDTIMESELFGHVKGAFTGAFTDKPGRFELASGGTLFLDEIGDLSRMGQADLLRVLEDGIYRPIGSRTTVRADARIVVATNRDLEVECREGRFRDDLFYRLNVVSVHLPPLRERPEDISRLAMVFLQHFCSRHSRPLKTFSKELEETLRRLPWPGNIRQLRNTIERMVLLAPGKILSPSDLPPHLATETSSRNGDIRDMPLARAEWALIQHAISKAGGNKAEAARRLGISRRTLHYMLKRGEPRSGH